MTTMTSEQMIRKMEELEEHLRKLEKQMTLLLQGVDSESNRSHYNTAKPCAIDIVIVKTLHELGIPSHLSGYKYLKTTVKLFVEDEISESFGITTDLYPKVAKLHNKTAQQVERAIRHAIGVGYDRGDFKLWEKLFGYSVSSQKGEPTNFEFIATLVEYIVTM